MWDNERRQYNRKVLIHWHLVIDLLYHKFWHWDFWRSFWSVPFCYHYQSPVSLAIWPATSIRFSPPPLPPVSPEWRSWIRLSIGACSAKSSFWCSSKLAGWASWHLRSCYLFSCAVKLTWPLNCWPSNHLICNHSQILGVLFFSWSGYPWRFNCWEQAWFSLTSIPATGF